jgi:hypothetical protein
LQVSISKQKPEQNEFQIFIKPHPLHCSAHGLNDEEFLSVLKFLSLYLMDDIHPLTVPVTVILDLVIGSVIRDQYM